MSTELRLLDLFENDAKENMLFMPDFFFGLDTSASDIFVDILDSLSTRRLAIVCCDCIGPVVWDVTRERLLGDACSAVRCTAEVVMLYLFASLADLTDRSDDRALKGMSIRLLSFSEAADMVARRGAVSRSAERVSSSS